MNKQTRRNFQNLPIRRYHGGLDRQELGSGEGCNETLRCATIGFRGRGNSHIGSIKGMQQREQGVKLTALRDVDKRCSKRRSQTQSRWLSGYPRDVKKEELDVVTVATSNHWHSLAAIWAVQAGMMMFTWRSP